MYFSGQGVFWVNSFVCSVFIGVQTMGLAIEFVLNTGEVREAAMLYSYPCHLCTKKYGHKHTLARHLINMHRYQL